MRAEVMGGKGGGAGGVERMGGGVGGVDPLKGVLKPPLATD